MLLFLSDCVHPDKAQRYQGHAGQAAQLKGTPAQGPEPHRAWGAVSGGKEGLARQKWEGSGEWVQATPLGPRQQFPGIPWLPWALISCLDSTLQFCRDTSCRVTKINSHFLWLQIQRGKLVWRRVGSLAPVGGRTVAWHRFPSVQWLLVSSLQSERNSRRYQAPFD